MLIVVTRHLIVIINIILITIVSVVKLENLKKYTNEFVLHVNEGEQAARSLADRYQLIFERRVSDEGNENEMEFGGVFFYKAVPNENYFVFRQIIIHSRRKRSLDGFDRELVRELQNDPLIDWVEQQLVKKRVKRSVMYYHPVKSSHSSSKFNDPDWNKQWYMVRNQKQNSFGINSFSLFSLA